MSVSTLTAGYPAHVVATYQQEPNPNGVVITDWTGVCGTTGRIVGTNPFKPAGNHRKLERCPKCFTGPGRDVHAYFPPPVRLDAS